MVQPVTSSSQAWKEQGLSDERNQRFMAMGYPPGPTKEVAKSLNLRDINTYMKLHEEFGDIFMLPLGDVPLVVTRSAEHIKELLGGSATELFPRPPNVIANIRLLFGRAQIALDGEEHQENKRMLSQWLFSATENAKMVSPFRHIIKDFMGRLTEDMAKQGFVEAYYIAELAAADISAAISMGRTYKALQLNHCPQLEALKRCDKIFLNRAMNKNWKQVETPETTKTFEDSKKLIADTFTDAFAKIKANPKKFDHNILEHMIEQNLMHRDAQCPMGRNPTELEAVSNMVGFLAGVGNTARMNTIGIEMIARLPDVQTKVLEELHYVLGPYKSQNLSEQEVRKICKEAAAKGMAVPGASDVRLFTYDKIMDLQYLRCVMHECLRLYTPSTSVAPRSCTQDSPLGGYTIPKGTNVMCNIYGAHRHPKDWDRPLEFDPMRFNDSTDKDNVHLKPLIPQGFFPFGYGGHGCIGKNLAQEVTLMIWAMLIANYEIRKAPGKAEAVFNTLKSDQILGFIEAVNGCFITIDKRAIDDKVEHVAISLLDKIEEEEDEVERKKTGSGKSIKTKSGKDRIISMDEVKQHTSRETGVWFVLHDKVYDATPWLEDHPGGADVLIRSAGKDVTKVFEITKHSSFAVAEAEKYRIGYLAEAAKL